MQNIEQIFKIKKLIYI